jgi:hypothetical protein
MSRRTKSATCVRNVCGRMYVRDLNRGTQDQQQSAEDCKDNLPVLARAVLGGSNRHPNHYNVPFKPRRGAGLYGVKTRTSLSKIAHLDDLSRRH